MRCMRIFGAYSYRLTRRHSTALLVFSLIAALTLIFQLYAHKHLEHPYTYHSIGDFDYRPGLFLKGQQPNENISYCQFNYGLPDALNWSTFKLLPSPQSGHSGPYRVIYNAIKGTAYENHSSYDAVTYATQATPEFIFHIIEIAKYWDGPISLAVYVPDYDLDITIQIMDHLCHCYAGMSKVSLHLFYPKRFPPKMGRMQLTTTPPPMSSSTDTNITIAEILKRKKENYRNLNNQTRPGYIQRAIKKKIAKMMVHVAPKSLLAPHLLFDDCSGPDSYDLPTFRKEKSMVYPINVGRNIARNASRTNYFIVSDIEMVPSDELAPRFLKMLTKLMGKKKRKEGCIVHKTVFVVPLFEVERGERIPRNKATLVALIADNRATYFHQKICTHCQRFPGLQTWIMRPPGDKVEPMMLAKREYPYHRWEPLYFGTNKEPWYSELLSWEGQQDKMTQMLEMCLQSYSMVILDGGFLCHAASTSVSKPRNKRAQRLNLKQYIAIIDELKKIYADKSQCKVNWGFR